MARRNFHDKPFEPHTLAKLRLFRDYLESWFGVWLKHTDNGLLICDPFAGPGQDSKGNPGSPLIIKQTVEKFREKIEANNGYVRVMLNDKLLRNVKKLRSEFSSDSIVHYDITRGDFSTTLNEAMQYAKQQYHPALFFLDQYGWRALTAERFLEIARLRAADLLFFVASGTMHRFETVYPFEEKLGIDFSHVDPIRPIQTVRAAYEKLAEEDSGVAGLFLGDFALVTNKNKYGLVFATKHERGISKFVNAAWKVDPYEGHGNSEDLQGDLFASDESRIIQAFRRDLRNELEKRHKMSLKEIARFAWRRGMMPTKHARSEIKKLLEDKKVEKVPQEVNLAFSYDALRDGKHNAVIHWIS